MFLSAQCPRNEKHEVWLDAFSYTVTVHRFFPHENVLAEIPAEDPKDKR